MKLDATRVKLAALDLELMVKSGDVIIDCGANIGSVTSLFARSGAIVYAFEPNPLSFTILSRRFRAMPTVHCFNQGVFDRQCRLHPRHSKPAWPMGRT